MREVNIKSNRSIERAISVFNCFSLEEMNLSLNQIVNKVGLPRTTLYRILHTLELMNYIKYDSNRDTYRLTMKLFELGTIAASSIYFAKEISWYLDELKTKTPHTILVAVLNNQQLLYLDKRESERELRVGSEIGRVREPDYGILGKTILSYLPPTDLNQIMEILETKRTNEDLAKLFIRLNEIRTLGYAYASDDTSIGVAGAAAPIFNKENRVFASFGILAPSAEVDEYEKKKIIDLVTLTAKKISDTLGAKEVCEIEKKS